MVNRIKIQSSIIVVLIALFCFSSCSDEPDQENYYTFTGEMMSDYLNSRQEYSMFTSIVEKAGLMPQLSTYGHYTCFLPNDEAVEKYLMERGITIDQLTVEDCDTIARTHLVKAIYSTFEMSDGVLPEMNMNDRPLKISHGTNADNNAITIINGQAEITFELQDDSVENGIVQPINAVLKTSTDLLPDLIKKNPKVQIFYDALVATGLMGKMNNYKDPSYKEPHSYDDGYFHDYISGANNHEAATPPDHKYYGYTAFLVPDSVLKAKYGSRYNFDSNPLEALYKLACDIYDKMYPEEVGLPEHAFSAENIKSPKNPLYKFLAYHLLDRNVQGANYLTVRDDFGIDLQKMNPTEWYGTLLPYRMMKLEHIMVPKYLGNGTRGEYYINRCYNGINSIEGIHIQKNVENEYENGLALNGIYFYVDDILKFDQDVRDIVFNCRMRMDFSTLFPELMSNNMRMNGDREHDDDNFASSYDHTFKYGRNYYFPDGYLDGVTVGNNGYFIYRRPHQNYWSYNGDEFDCQGNYDISFRIPPVPFESDYQIRLGYAAMEGLRGVAQIYFDNVPQGIPLDMNIDLRNDALLGAAQFGKKLYTNMTEEEKQEDRKTLKNKGYYRGANGAFHTGDGGSTKSYFSNEYATIRIVLCTVHIKPDTDHYLRIRAVSSKSGNDNEAMLDYLEIVPKSVYGVSDEGQQEDDL